MLRELLDKKLWQIPDRIKDKGQFEENLKNIPTTAQQTLPYREMYRDGVCRVADRYYTKTIEYEDINYQLAQSEDQAAIFDGWSACLNYFDSSLPFQLSFLNHRSRPGSRYSVNIPMQDDDYNSVRCGMWKCWKTRSPKATTALSAQSS